MHQTRSPYMNPQKRMHAWMGEGLLEISHSRWPLVFAPISNHTDHEIILLKRTELGSLQHITKIIVMGKPEPQQEEGPPVQVVQAQVNSTTSEPPSSGPWKPPVDLSHLKPEQQRLVGELLYAESAAFARDRSDIDIGYPLPTDVN